MAETPLAPANLVLHQEYENNVFSMNHQHFTEFPQSSVSVLGMQPETMNRPVFQLQTQNSGFPVVSTPPQGGRHSINQANTRRLWACPLYKWDPSTHYRCVEKHKLSRYYDVKQHLSRDHKLLASDSLNVGSMPQRYGDRHEQKWYQMWDNLFMGHQRPSSPYVEEGIAEPLALLRHRAESLLEANIPYLSQAVNFQIDAHTILTLGREIQRIIFKPFSVPELPEFSTEIGAPLHFPGAQDWANTMHRPGRTLFSVSAHDAFQVYHHPQPQFTSHASHNIPNTQFSTALPLYDITTHERYPTSELLHEVGVEVDLSNSGAMI